MPRAAVRFHPYATHGLLRARRSSNLNCSPASVLTYNNVLDVEKHHLYGDSNVLACSNCTIVGSHNIIIGNHNVVHGSHNVVLGDRCYLVDGSFCTVDGNFNTVMMPWCNVKGDFNFILSENCQVSGNGTRWGSVLVNGVYSQIKPWTP